MQLNKWLYEYNIKVNLPDAFRITDEEVFRGALSRGVRVTAELGVESSEGDKVANRKSAEYKESLFKLNKTGLHRK